MKNTATTKKRILILGGGFGGAYAALHLEKQLARDPIVATMRGQPPQPFKFKMLGMLAAIGRRTGVAEILGMKFSGIIAWWLWRCIYLSKLPGFAKKVRVALDWILDLVFSKDLVQLPTFRSPTISEAEETSSPTSGTKPAVTAAPKS